MLKQIQSLILWLDFTKKYMNILALLEKESSQAILKLKTPKNFWN